MGFKTEKKTLKKEKNLLKQHLQVILFSWGTWKWWLPVVWREVTEEVNIRHLTASKTLMCSGKLAKGGWVSYQGIGGSVSVSFLWALRCGLADIYVIEVMMELECYSSSPASQCTRSSPIHSCSPTSVSQPSSSSDSLIEDITLLKSREVSTNALPRSRRWIWNQNHVRT